MTKRIKFQGIKELDNIETIEGLNDVLKSWLESLSMPFETHSTSIENFEFKSRDGFYAHRHNCGGVDLLALTTVASLIGSGEHVGLAIEDKVSKTWDESYNAVAEQSPEMDVESDEFYDAVRESCDGDYDAVAWRVRVMYEGLGVLKIYAQYDEDAPYFRFRGPTLFETEVKFTTLSALERKLKALTKKVEASQNEKKVSKAA